MNPYCQRHYRYRCQEAMCRPRSSTSYGSRSSDFGGIGINTEGNLTMGLGGGLTMDMEDGSLGMSVLPGFSVDFGD